MEPILTRNCFDRRRQWIQDRLEFLAGVFAVDVLGFSVTSNHLHVVLRNQPGVVTAWSDDDVAAGGGRSFLNAANRTVSPLRRMSRTSP